VVPVRVPRVREVPEDVAPEGYRSRIVPRYQRRSQQTQELFCRLYLEELSSGDLQPSEMSRPIVAVRAHQGKRPERAGARSTLFAAPAAASR